MPLNTKGNNFGTPAVPRDLENKTYFFYLPFILEWIGQNHKECLPAECAFKKNPNNLFALDKYQMLLCFKKYI